MSYVGWSKIIEETGTQMAKENIARRQQQTLIRAEEATDWHDSTSSLLDMKTDRNRARLPPERARQGGVAVKVDILDR